MPSHLKLPSISGSDRDTKIEQQVTKLLFEERDKLWHAKLGEDVTVVAEIRATVRGPGTGNDWMNADEYQIPVYDVSSIDLSITTREESERRLDFYCGVYAPATQRTERALMRFVILMLYEKH